MLLFNLSPNVRVGWGPRSRTIVANDEWGPGASGTPVPDAGGCIWHPSTRCRGLHLAPRCKMQGCICQEAWFPDFKQLIVKFGKKTKVKIRKSPSRRRRRPAKVTVIKLDEQMHRFLKFNGKNKERIVTRTWYSSHFERISLFVDAISVVSWERFVVLIWFRLFVI